MKQHKPRCKDESHSFESQKGEKNRYHIKGCGETLEKIIICRDCGLKAREIWIYSCTMDDSDKEI